jgi:hypothetical protein
LEERRKKRLAKGIAELPERPQDESGPGEARPASLHRLGSQAAKQRQGRGSKAPEGLDRHWHEGQGGNTCRYTRRLEASLAAAAKPWDKDEYTLLSAGETLDKLETLQSALH